MKVYLVRHAQAHPMVDSDANRSLTEEGKRDAAILGQKLVALDDFSVDRIVHSGYVRARQTAEIVHRHVVDSADELSLAVDPSLVPHGDIDTWISILSESSVPNMMLVGHMPFMGELAGSLLGDYTSFKRPSCCVVVRTESGWKLHSYITAQS